MTARLVVVGDSLLDRDLIGSADRLSPEAPAPVVDLSGERTRPGGAALTALLAAAGGRPVTLVTALAADEPARELARLLAGRVELVALPAGGSTAVKTRVRVRGQTLLRLDSGEPGQVAGDEQEVRRALSGAGAVLVSDYGRGVAAAAAVRRALTGFPGPLCWDPHPRGATPLPGARLVTPNAAEAARAAGGIADGTPDGTADGTAGLADTRRHADLLVRRWAAQAVSVTLGRLGALLSFGGGSPLLVPAEPVDAADTCGAGDAFAAAAAGALADGRLPSEAVAAAVAAAGRFVAAGAAGGLDRDREAPNREAPNRRAAGAGAAAVVARTRAAGGRVIGTGGCFDLLHAGHIATLTAARRLGDALVVCVNSDDSVRRLKGPGRPLVPAADRVRVLAELGCVDAVEVFDEDSPERVLDRLRPDVWVKGGDYAGRELPEAAILGRWGGEVLVLPYLSGRSTAGLVAAARRE